MTVPIVIDCDPGHDDAIAILLALASPEVELVGVTTVAGVRSASKRSCWRKVSLSASPRRRARSVLCATRAGSISSPTPRAPRSLAAAIRMRPSPEPRS